MSRIGRFVSRKRTATLYDTTIISLSALTSSGSCVTRTSPKLSLRGRTRRRGNTRKHRFRRTHFVSPKSNGRANGVRRAAPRRLRPTICFPAPTSRAFVYIRPAVLLRDGVRGGKPPRKHATPSRLNQKPVRIIVVRERTV